jgi:RND family efflux transporter MFP subunit
MMRGSKALLPLVALALGVLGAVGLLATAPAVETREAERVPPRVNVVEVRAESLDLTVRTHGTVAPRTESHLVPEVSGRVLWVSPSLASGGFFEEGEPLVRVDPRDYEVVLERAKAALARTESEHRRASRELERRRGLAERDYASPAELDTSVSSERVAAAAVREARAVLEQAARDLGRSELVAPFKGRVREESVDVGQFVNRGAPIATLYAVDYVEIRLPIPDDELAFVDLPILGRAGEERSGPEVILRATFAGASHLWRGRIVRTEGEIDPKTRMVHAVAHVEDPYGRAAEGGRPPLAVGLFVEAEIVGRHLESVIALPRAALRGDDRVLVVDGESRLRFRSVDVLRRSGERVVIRAGLEPGERVCVSQLDTFVEGMLVRPRLLGPEAS